MYRMNCWILFVIIDSLYIYGVCGLTPYTDQLNALMKIAVTDVTNKWPCSCLDETRAADCSANSSATGCTACEPTGAICPSTVNFCNFMECFGTLCERLWGSYMCQCQDGSLCYKSDPNEDAPPRTLVEIKPEVGELQHTYVLVYRWNRKLLPSPSITMEYVTGAGLEFTVTTDLFHLRNFAIATKPGVHMSYIPPGKGNQGSLKLYGFWFYYPYSEEKIYSNKLIVGGLETVTHTLNFEITPTKLKGKCYPTINLLNCSNSNVKPSVWFRGNKYTLKTQQTAQCQKSTLSSTLRITRLGTSREIPPFPVFFRLQTLANWGWDYGDNWYKSFSGTSTDFRLDSYDMAYGLNAAVLEVAESPAPGTGYKAGKNVVMCYFVLKPVPTKARILGSEKPLVVSEFSSFWLDGSLSTNPNARPDQREATLGYSWTCWDRDRPVDTMLCKGPEVELGNGTSFSPTSGLIVTRHYVFQLKTYDKTVNTDRYLTDSTATVNVSVEPHRTMPTYTTVTVGQTTTERITNPTVTVGQTITERITNPTVTVGQTITERITNPTVTVGQTITESTTNATTEVLPLLPTKLKIAFCVEMCGCSTHKSHTEELVFLQASCTDQCPTNLQYAWDTIPHLSLMGKTVFEPSDKLIIKSNVFTEGKTYVFSVRGGNGGFAKHTLTMNKRPLPGKCDVTPRSGKVEDLFTLTCTGFRDEDVDKPMSFRVYQEDISEVGRKCLMAVSVESHPWAVKLSGLQLMEGMPTKLVIEAVDFYGSVASTTGFLEVKPPEGGWTMETIQRIFDSNKDQKTESRRIRTVFVIADGLTKVVVNGAKAAKTFDSFKSAVAKNLLHWLDKIQLKLGTDVMQVTDALHTMIKKNKNTLTQHEITQLASALAVKLVKKLQKVANSGPQFGCLSKKGIEQISISLVQLTTLIFGGASATEPEEVDETKPGDADNLYPDYTVFNIKDIEKGNNMNKASNDAMKTLDILSAVFSKNQADSSKHNSIVTDFITMWSKTGRPCDMADKYLPDFSNTTGPTYPCQATTVRINAHLCRHLATIAPLLELKVTTYLNNPQSFKTGSNKLNTEFVSISMVPFVMGSTGKDVIEKLAFPLDIFLKLKQNASTDREQGKNLETGTVAVDTGVDWDDMEDNITVHRVTLNKGAKMMVIFENKDLSFGISAVITQESRPTMKDFELSTLVSQSDRADHEAYDVQYPGYAIEDGAWFYLGVLPDKNVVANDSRRMGGGNMEFNYSFNIFQVICLYMKEDSHTWLTDACVIGPDTKYSCLHCQCQHLSVFTGSINLLPSKLDSNIGVRVFFLLVNNNLFVVGVVVAVLLGFLLALVWARWRDKCDLNDRRVTVLEDNKPGHDYAYLLIVHTGHRWRAGTTSTIGFKLQGSQGKSGPHIFSDSTRLVLQRGTESPFLLLVESGLGDLQHLQIWSNNSGRNPQWYCNKIVVTEVVNRRTWEFFFNMWLSVSKGQGQVYTLAVPIRMVNLYSKKKVFLASLFHDLQDLHIWTSVWMKHPLNTFTRCQRLSVAVSGLLFMMLCVIFFDGGPRDNLNTILNEHITISWWIFLLVVCCALVVEILLILLSTLFRRSHSIEDYNSEVDRSMSTPKNHSELNVPSPYKADPMYKKYKRTVSCRFHYVAWIACIAIICTSACVTIYYGLSYTKPQSSTWLMWVLLAFIVFLLIVEPLKMLLRAFCGVISHEKRTCLSKFARYINRAIATRQKSTKSLHPEEVYRPLRHKEKQQKKNAETNKNKIEHMLLDLVVFLFYILTLFFTVLSKQDDFSYLSMQNTIDTIVDVSLYRSLSNVHTMQDLFDYLNNTFIPRVFVSSYYNGDNVSEYALTADYNTRLLGIPRLRQLRVRNQTCTLYSTIRNTNISDDCIGEFSKESEDSNDYSLRWTKDLNSYPLVDEKVKAVWKYSSDTVTQSMPMLGEFFVYPAGGYVANLGRTESNSRTILNFLWEYDWLDQRTRVVFIEFTTYNANRNLFNVVTLMVERSPSTVIVTTNNVATVRLLNLKENVVTLHVFFFIAVTLIILHYVRNVFHLKGNVWEEFISFWNMVDLCIILLCITSLIIYTLRDAFVRELLKKLETSNWNEYVSFALATNYNIYFSYSLSLLVCLSTCRLWRLLHFNKVFRQMESTLSHSVKQLFSLFCLMTVLLSMFATTGALLFGHFSKEFISYYKSLCTLIVFANRMLPKLNLDRIVFVYLYISIIYFVLFWLAYTFYFFNLFFAVLTARIEMLRTDRTANIPEPYGPCDYLREECRYLWNKLKNNRFGALSHLKRLRGGKETDLNLIAAPKSSNTRENVLSVLSTARREAMSLLTLDVVKRVLNKQEDRKAVGFRAALKQDSTDVRSKAMLALVLDKMNLLDSEGEVYVRRKMGQKTIMTDNRLVVMETTLNRFTRTNVDLSGFKDV